MKKKALVLAVCMAFSTPALSSTKVLQNDLLGLNLGELNATSYLNEPFSGSIPVLFTTNSQAKKLKVRIASADVFSQVGLDKSAVLNGLTFRVVIENNKPVIRVRSTHAINLPFLSFILEIKTPKGSIYQDYTAMLDPRLVQSNNASLVPVTPTTLVSKKHLLVTPNTHKVAKGESLSKIAQKFKSNKISLSKLMEGILLKNPSAFINSDINKIRAGKTLKIPSISEVKVLISSAQAMVKSKPIVENEQVIDIEKSESATNNSEHTYTVKSGDTLSKITKLFLSKESSFTKSMKAIYLDNPHAFSQNRINILKVGAVLNIPTAIDEKVDLNNNDQIVSTEADISKENTVSNTMTSQLPNESNNVQTEESIKTETSASTNQNKNVLNLEKRVRELRAELTESQDIYITLKDSLKRKNLLIKDQNEEINLLQMQLDEYIGVEPNNTISEMPITPQVESVSNGIIAKQENIETISQSHEEKLQQKMLTAKIEKLAYIPENWLTQQIKDINSKVSTKDLSLSALALILGLLLIRYRRELYTYTQLPTKKSTTAYPSAATRSSKSRNKKVTYASTLVPNELTSVPTQNKKNPSEINESQIQECEALVDDLLEGLDENHEFKYNKDPIISDLNDQEMDILHEDKSIESLNLFQEVLDDSNIKDENAIKDLLDELQDHTESADKKSQQSNISFDEFMESISLDKEETA